jgi:hypothetical protein
MPQASYSTIGAVFGTAIVCGGDGDMGGGGAVGKRGQIVGVGAQADGKALAAMVAKGVCGQRLLPGFEGPADAAGGVGRAPGSPVAQTGRQPGSGNQAVVIAGFAAKQPKLSVTAFDGRLGSRRGWQMTS